MTEDAVIEFCRLRGFEPVLATQWGFSFNAARDVILIKTNCSTEEQSIRDSILDASRRIEAFQNFE